MYEMEGLIKGLLKRGSVFAGRLGQLYTRIVNKLETFQLIIRIIYLRLERVASSLVVHKG